MTPEQFREELAKVMHESWSGWARYMIDNWSPANRSRWERQIATRYEDLSEQEKDSDRKEAYKVMAVVAKYLASSMKLKETDE